jgi:hypothetical protein
MGEPQTYTNIQEALEAVVKSLLPKNGKDLTTEAEVVLIVRLGDLVNFIRSCHNDATFARMHAPTRRK